MTDYKGLCRELVWLDQAEPGDYADWKQAWSAAIERARAALAEPVPEMPQPIPVSERWPEFSDCDSAERVWCWSWAIGTWRLSRINRSIHSHWLPVHALPLPS